MKQTILTKESSAAEIRRYFKAVLKLSQSDQEFPVNLDEVFPLVYSRKEEAVRALLSDSQYLQDIDYQVLRKNAENPTGGRPKIDYLLSVPCMEFFIARKVRPVFEVYRKVFHKAACKPIKTINPKEVEKLKEEITRLEDLLKWSRAIQQQETDLKNSCFIFLIGKDLYTEYHYWMERRIPNVLIKEIKTSFSI